MLYLYVVFEVMLYLFMVFEVLLKVQGQTVPPAPPTVGTVD